MGSPRMAALSRTGPGEPVEQTTALRPWVILAALTLGRVAFGYQFQTVATLGPDLVPLFHLSYAELGALIGAYMLLGAFVALPLGLLGRWLGDRTVTGIGMALMVAGPCISALGSDPSAIAAGRIVAGVGGVGMLVPQGKIIADWFIGSRLILAMSIVVCGYPVGVGLAQVILPAVSHSFGWPAGFFSGIVIPGVALVLFLASYTPPPNEAEVPQRFALPSLRECLLVAIAGMIFTAYTAGSAGYFSYVPSTLARRGTGLAMTGLVVAIAAWGNPPATLFGGGLAGRIGVFSVLLIGTLGLTVGTAGTALMGLPILWSVLIGVVGSLHPGVIVTLGTLSTRREHRVVGMGMFYSLFFAGGTIGPALCGRVADRYHSPAGGLLAAAAISAMVIPLFLLHRWLAANTELAERL
jgi:predicted MFS family arabinose efflux permease